MRLDAHHDAHVGAGAGRQRATIHKGHAMRGSRGTRRVHDYLEWFRLHTREQVRMRRERDHHRIVHRSTVAHLAVAAVAVLVDGKGARGKLRRRAAARPQASL